MLRESPYFWKYSPSKLAHSFASSDEMVNFVRFMESIMLITTSLSNDCLLTLLAVSGIGISMFSLVRSFNVFYEGKKWFAS